MLKAGAGGSALAGAFSNRFPASFGTSRAAPDMAAATCLRLSFYSLLTVAKKSCQNAARFIILKIMPQPLTWNSGLVWNSSAPGAVWNGTVTTQHTNMTQDLIQLDISDADWADIDAALDTLETKLGVKLRDLSIDERKTLVKMGGKSEAFCRQSLVVGRQNVSKLPADTAADLALEEADLAALDKLRPRLARLTSLSEKASDSSMALGSDIMVFCLSLYGVLKALGVGNALDALRTQLGLRFKRGPRSKPDEPASES